MSDLDNLLQKISQFYQAGNYREVINHLNTSVMRDNNHPYLSFYLAKSQQAQNVNPLSVADTCEAGLKQFPDYQPLRVIAFYSYINAGKTELAIAKGLSVYESGFIDIQLYFDLANLLHESGRIDEFKQVIRDANYQAVLAHYYRGDYNQALKFVENLKNRESDFCLHELFEVRIYIAQGRLDRAIELALSYRNHDGIQYDILQLLIDLHIQLNNENLAREYAKELLSAYPEDSHAQKQCLRLFQTEKSIQNSLSEANNLLAKDELDFWLHIENIALSQKLIDNPEFLNGIYSEEEQWRLINALYDTGVKEHSIQSAIALIKPDSNFKQLVSFCHKLEVNHDYRLLLELLESFQILEWNEPELCASYISALACTKSLTEACNFADEALKVFTDNPVILWKKTKYKIHSTIYNAQAPDLGSELNELLANLKSELITNPENALAHLFIGYAYCALGDYKLADSSINKARSIGLVGNLMPVSAYWLAYANYELENFAEALSTYDKLFAARVPDSWDLSTYNRLKQKIADSIQKKTLQRVKTRTTYKVPLVQRVIFSGLFLYLNWFLHTNPVAEKMLMPSIVKVFAALCFLASIYWVGTGMRDFIRSPEADSAVKEQ
jgi:hypothetical protein